MKKLGLLVCLMLWYAMTWGQVTALRCQKIRLSSTPFCVDTTATIVPNSVKLTNADTIIKAHYNLNSNTLYFSGKFREGDSAQICYRIFPLLLTKEYFNRDMKQYHQHISYTDYGRGKIQPQPTERKQELISTPNLQKTGSITRGLSLGNTQNAFVNSALNLQLDGQLSENLKLTAVISDQSIPYQPQGNTQQLREFDRVYVQLATPKTRLLAGDIVLQQLPESYFLRYYKNVQGGSLSAQWSDSNSHAETSVAAAVSKGKFYSDSVAVSEGVQGPYRLKAPSNEIFIVILANSEKVYLDGQLLKRGFNFDYVIDYNQGEITFTNNVLITRYSRVRVDFEYAERNYNRSIMMASHKQSIGDLSFFMNLYQEADNPNKPLSFELNSETTQLLSSIGDQLDKAIISGATRQNTYTEGQIYYTKILAPNGIDSIFQYTSQPTEGQIFYQVIFSDAGEGKGSYQLQNSLVNGKIYEWAGEGLGRYTPVRQIITPKKKTMSSFGSQYNLGKNWQVFGEMAFSQNDLNRYSKENTDDDKGHAYKIGINLKGKKISKKLHINSKLYWENLSRNFSPIDRFRTVEFDRNWTSNSTTQATDRLLSFQTQLLDSNQNLFQYEGLYRQKGNLVNGWQQNISINTNPQKRFGTTATGFYLLNNTTDGQTHWYKLGLNPSYKNKWLTGVYSYNTEKNRLLDKVTDNIVSSVIYFDEHRFSLQNPESSKDLLFNLSYSWRSDQTPENGNFRKSTQANTLNASFTKQTKKQNKLTLTLTYRTLDNYLVEKSAQEQTLMSRVDWTGDYLKRHIRSELVVSTSTGQELKREYQFVKVATLGEGTHQWIDSNGDGIAQIDEFVEAQLTQDRQYIKVFVPTNEYVPAYQGKWVYKINAQMPLKWRNSTNKIKAVASLFSLNTALSADRKITAGSALERFTPLGNLPETQLLSVQQSWRNVLFFNRSSPSFGGDLTWLQSGQKQLLTNGFDNRQNTEWRLLIRGNLNRYFNLQTTLQDNTRKVSSDFQLLRNYNIKHREISPEIAFQPSPTLRVSISGAYSHKNNKQGTEQAQIQKIGTDLKWSQFSERNFQFGIKYTQIRYNALNNTPLAYEMLEGLTRGQNLTWQGNWQQRLSNGLQLQISYEGRRSENQSTVHIGRVQLTALF